MVGGLLPHRNLLFRQELFHIADGEFAEVENARGGSHELELFGGNKGQTAFAFEKLFQPSVAGAALAPDDFRCNAIAQFAAIAPALEPVFPTD
jgi:hypothetical protein